MTPRYRAGYRVEALHVSGLSWHAGTVTRVITPTLYSDPDDGPLFFVLFDGRVRVGGSSVGTAARWTHEIRPLPLECRV